MTQQTHKVATDALDTLGTHPIPDNSGRDAIHLAVEPVIAGAVLHAGQRVILREKVAIAAGTEATGIVDPFLTENVLPGQRFWLVVLPRQITSLRHVWSHPAFPEEGCPGTCASGSFDPAIASREWIKQFADRIPLRYETVMEGARNWLADKRSGGWGEYLNFGGLLEGESVPDEFWRHYEIVTGDKVDEDHRDSFFTCSC